MSSVRFARDGTAFEVHGSEQNNDPIFLIHGLGLNREITWSSHLEALTEQHQVVAYDLMGHGQSPKPKAKPSLDLFADQLKNLLDELNVNKASIVGFSLGGMINRRFAMKYPDQVNMLGIFNSPHDRGEGAQKQVEERAAQSAAGGPGANIETTLQRWFTPDYMAKRPEVIEQVKQIILANDPENYAHSRMVLASGVKELIRPDPPIAKPALVITCENDSGSTPDMSYSISSEIAGSKVLIVPHLQHMGLVEQPEAFTDPLLAFLQEQ